MKELSNDAVDVIDRFDTFLTKALAKSPPELKSFYFEWDVTSSPFLIEFVSGALWGYIDIVPDFGNGGWESIGTFDEYKEKDYNDPFCIENGTFFGFWYRMDDESMVEFDLTVDEVITRGFEANQAAQDFMSSGKKFYFAMHDGIVKEYTNDGVKEYE